MRIAAVASLVIGGILFIMSALWPSWVQPVVVEGALDPEEAEMLVIEASNLRHEASIPGSKADTSKLEEAEKLLADAKQAQADAESRREFGQRVFRYGGLGAVVIGVICFFVAKAQEG